MNFYAKFVTYVLQKHRDICRKTLIIFWPFLNCFEDCWVGEAHLKILMDDKKIWGRLKNEKGKKNEGKVRKHNFLIFPYHSHFVKKNYFAFYKRKKKIF